MTKPRDWFSGKGPMRKARTFKIAGIDTETYGIDGRLLIVTVYHEDWDPSEARAFDTMEEALQFIFNLPKKQLLTTIWFSHNAEYDWRYALEEFKPLSKKYNIIPKERMTNKFYEIEFTSKTETTNSGRQVRITRFRDSMAIFNEKLSSLTKSFAPEYDKQDIGLADGVIFDPSNSSHVKYALNDVVGLVKGLIKFDETLWEHFQVHITGTFASTAYQAFLRTIPKDQYHTRVGYINEEMLRKCYHGGAVRLNALIGHEYPLVGVFDINSSYPAQMRKGVPCGKPSIVKRYERGVPGFYHVVAHVPLDAILPIIPCRVDHGLSFPVGTFETYISSIELEYAKARGCTFEIKTGLIFRRGLWHPFNDMVDKCEALRKQYKGTGTEIVAKFIQNSLYGKFGTKPEGREVVFSWDGIPEGYNIAIDEETGDVVSYLFWRPSDRDCEYMMPHYAAWITANARLTLDQMGETIGREFVLYGDTDSVHFIYDQVAIERAQVFLGNEYGKSKLEKTLFGARYHAPKYITARAYTDKTGSRVEDWFITAKGIPKKLVDCPNETCKNYRANMRKRNELCAKLHSEIEVSVEFHSSTSLNTCVKTGKFGVERTRRATKFENVRSHCLGEGGLTRPRVMNYVDYEREAKLDLFRLNNFVGQYDLREN
jgi:DNA polymerase type B, organellar and viral